MKFLKASFQGWIYCRDHPTDCVNIVLKNGSLLGRGHQTLADERDQRADVAEPEGHRPAARGRGRADGGDRARSTA